MLSVFDAVSLQCLWLVIKETICSQGRNYTFEGDMTGKIEIKFCVYKGQAFNLKSIKFNGNKDAGSCVRLEQQQNTGPAEGAEHRAPAGW